MSNRRAQVFLAAMTVVLGASAAAQQGDPTMRRDAAIAELSAILNREVKTEEADAARAAEAASWLAKHAAVAFEDGGFLDALAKHFGTRDAAERTTAQDIVWKRVVEKDGYPVAGFEQPARRLLLLRGLRLAESGAWSECREYLPFLKRYYDDRAAIYWLVGRRARDHGSPEGKAFLHDVVIPEILLDPTLDDIARVTELRRLYDVQYTGPRPFAHIEGPSLDGKRISTASHAGKVLIVDYWATWCVPCMQAMPGVVAAWQRYREQGLEVIGVALDAASSREKVLEVVRAQGIGWPQIFDGLGTKSELMTKNRVTAIPALFLIDRQGRVRWTDLEGEELMRRVGELIAEK